MTVNELMEACGLTAILLPDGEREVSGAYAGDLLSWVMGRASEGNAFVTIMTNLNVIAVASLRDLSCVIFAEGVSVPQEVIDVAVQKEVNLLGSRLPAYETCAALSRCLP